MYQKILNVLPKSRFLKSVTILVGGTAGGQLVTILAAPLLTRLYTPEDFGILAVYVAILSLVTVIASLRYELTIPLPDDDYSAANTTILCLALVLAVSVLTGLILFFCMDQITDLTGDYGEQFVWLLPIGVAFVGSYQVLSFWSVRKKKFGSIAKTRLQQALAMVSIQIISFKLGGIGLVLGQASGQGVGVIHLAQEARANGLSAHIEKKQIVFMFRRYASFSLFSSLSGLINSAGQNIAPLALAFLFGSSGAGLFALAHRVLSAPMSIVGKAVGQVFLSSGTEANREGVLDRLVSDVFLKLLMVVLPICTLLLLFSQDIFVIVFGESWAMSGVIAQCMVLLIFSQFICSPLSQVLAIVERQDLSFVFNAILTVVRISALMIFGLSFDLMGAVLAYSLGSFLGYCAFTYIILRVADVNLKNIFKESLPYIILTSSFILVFYGLLKYLDIQLFICFLLFLVYLFLYAFLARRDIEYN